MTENMIRDLGEGLILRRATLEDTDKLAEYNAKYLSDEGPDQPFEPLEHWTRDLMTNHPTMTAGDFTLVEDTKTGKIVSSLCLISQTWAFDGIPFGMGRPELVSTHRDYRRRGLVQAQFEVIHEWSAARGEWGQAITGIPWYYRQFGYEMALELGGGRMGYRPHVPKLKKDESEPFNIRPAAPADIPFVQEVYAHAGKRRTLTCLRDEAMWQYEIKGRSEKSLDNAALCIIETPEGELVGMLVHPRINWPPSIMTFFYELKAGASWLKATPSVIRYLQKTGEEYAEKDEKNTWEAFYFSLGSDHPVYQVADNRLPRTHTPYAWYIRVADIPGFLQHIGPALERRLAASEHAGHSGKLELNFYRSGVRLTFENGALKASEAWQPSTEARGHARFPGLSFLQLLFGYKSFDELDSFHPDCGRGNNDEAYTLLTTLFPKHPEAVWGIV